MSPFLQPLGHRTALIGYKTYGGPFGGTRTFCLTTACLRKRFKLIENLARSAQVQKECWNSKKCDLQRVKKTQNDMLVKILGRSKGPEESVGEYRKKCYSKVCVLKARWNCVVLDGFSLSKAHMAKAGSPLQYM
jgi:hypothetical protein